MKIKKVEIEAFRAYKSKLDGTFDFTNEEDIPSNFVAIYAPNGFGKSSFYDAVEWAVTNHLERLGGEYNKSNLEIAAKITKTSDKGQKILRNKDADEQMITKVVVSTTWPVLFERELPQLRKNQRDVRIGDNKQRENAFFKRVILGQDEIDRFLREAKPQDRYSKFMESFGGDIEIARKELLILINDNEIERVALQQQSKLLTQKLEQPIDHSVFESFNSVAAELNLLGENIVLANETFSSQSEHQLNSILVARQHELNTSLQVNTRILDTLIDSLAKTPEIELHTRYLTEQKVQLTKLSKGVGDADKYQTLLESYHRCETDQKETNARLIRLINISESAESFIQIESSLHELSTKLKVLIGERSKSSEYLSGLVQTQNQLHEELTISDNRALLLRNSLDNASQVFQEISTHRTRLGILAPKISDKDISIQIDNAKLDELNSERRTVSALNITSDFLSVVNAGILIFDQAKIDQLTKCYADIDLIDLNNQAIHATQKALSEQMNMHEQLIAIGLDYLSVQPSDVCPLCSAQHPTADALLDKIKNQNLLSVLSQENSHKLSRNTIRQQELRETILSITQQAIEAQLQQLNNLSNKINEIGERLTQLKQEKSTLQAEHNLLENRIAVLEKSVWDLSNEEFVYRVEGELTQLSVKRLNLIAQQADITSKIEVTTELVKSQDSKLSSLTSEKKIKSNEYVYVTVSTYLHEHAIAFSDLASHYEMKKNELDAEALKHTNLKEYLTGQLNVLQQEMVDDGTWINFEQLKSQKEALENSVADSQSLVNLFYESLSGFIKIPPEYTLDQVKKLIKTIIDDFRCRNQDLENRSNSIKLLLELMASFKPYIEHIALKEQLTLVHKQLEQRERVNMALEADLASIVDKLQTLINDFFYEDLINAIYRKIDPHPDFKKVEFKTDFEGEKPSLHILVSDSTGDKISPILYFSAAQTNILSLSVFLANALHTKDDENSPIDVVMIDDPIQSMDSINVLAMIDLLRSICLQFNKQVIISTHDENFFGLLQRKIPAQIFGSKFLQLEKFGVVKPVKPFLN